MAGHDICHLVESTTVVHTIDGRSSPSAHPSRPRAGSTPVELPGRTRCGGVHEVAFKHLRSNPQHEVAFSCWATCNVAVVRVPLTDFTTLWLHYYRMQPTAAVVNTPHVRLLSMADMGGSTTLVFALAWMEMGRCRPG